MSRHKTPLRYPGGKQKLAPFVAEVLATNALMGAHYVEPYAGGAGVAIELLLSGKVQRIHLNDSSAAVHAFWWAITRFPDQFCRKIASASLTIEEWRRQKEILSRPKEFEKLDVGFSLFFLSRCNRSGIPSAGPIGGYSQQGRWKMDARFDRNDLIRRVEAIGARSDLISIRNWDAERFISDYIPRIPDASLVYCDPPYYRKADRLYLNHYSPTDHERIAAVIQNRIARPWIVSYDCAPEVLGFYSRRQSFTYELQYNAAKAYKGKEVFVFSDDLRIPSRSSVPCINTALASL